MPEKPAVRVSKAQKPDTESEEESEAEEDVASAEPHFVIGGK